jgi:hypothetical protein
VVRIGKLADALAHAVSRAYVREAGAGCALTGCAIVAREALALASFAVAGALVRALHVVVSGVADLTEVRVTALRKLLRGTVGVVEAVLGDEHIGSGDGTVHVEVSLGGVDVGKTILTNSYKYRRIQGKNAMQLEHLLRNKLTLRAIISLPVAVANAHIVASALAVAVTAVGTLGTHHGDG